MVIKDSSGHRISVGDKRSNSDTGEQTQTCTKLRHHMPRLGVIGPMVFAFIIIISLVSQSVRVSTTTDELTGGWL